MTPGNVDIETLSKIMSNIGAPNWSRAKQVDSTTNVYDERPRRMSATDVCDGCLRRMSDLYPYNHTYR